MQGQRSFGKLPDVSEPPRAWWDKWLLIPLIVMVVLTFTGVLPFVIANPAIVPVVIVLALAAIGANHLINDYLKNKNCP